MQTVIPLAILIYAFVSTTVAAYLGIKTVDTFALFFFIPIIFREIFIDDTKLILKKTPEIRIFFLGIILCCIKVFLSDFDSAKYNILFMSLPIMLSMILAKQSVSIKYSIQKIILFFFVAECMLAIVEKTSNVNVFPYNYDNATIDWMINSNAAFRSTAFLGHPLANALVVSIILGFILISNLNLWYKFLLYLLGITAMLCFNARGATLIWVGLSVIFLYKTLKESTHNPSRKRLLYFLIIVCISVLYFLVINFDFGDRLFVDKIYDGSAQTRLDVFKSFSFLNSNDLIFGNRSKYLIITDKLGAGGVENSYIVMIINWGIPAFIIAFITYFIWIKKSLENLSISNKVIILFSFILVGSTNNGLASAPAWMFFIFCLNSFVIPNSYYLKLKILQRLSSESQHKS